MVTVSVMGESVTLDRDVIVTAMSVVVSHSAVEQKLRGEPTRCIP